MNTNLIDPVVEEPLGVDATRAIGVRTGYANGEANLNLRSGGEIQRNIPLVRRRIADHVLMFVVLVDE